MGWICPKFAETNQPSSHKKTTKHGGHLWFLKNPLALKKHQIFSPQTVPTTPQRRRIKAQWHTTCFEFSTWKGREVPCVLVGSKVTEIQESLEAQDRSDGVRCGHNFKVLMWYNVWLNKWCLKNGVFLKKWWFYRLINDSFSMMVVLLQTHTELDA